MWSDRVQQAAINATIKRVTVALTPLLQSWHLDPAEKNEVIKILHDLETQRMENYVNHLKDGVAGARKTIKEDASDAALADFRLDPIIGRNRTAELLKARQEVLNGMSAQGIKNANAEAAKN